MREVGSFQTSQSKRRYWLLTASLVVAALLFTAGLLSWGCLLYTSPSPRDS